MGEASYKLDLILQEVGAFGRYQILQYALLSLAVIFSAATSIAYVFTAGKVPHRCLIPECGDTSDSSQFLPPWWNEAIPSGDDGSPSSCSMYIPLNSTSGEDSCHFNNSSKQDCDQWVYDGKERTIMTEFTLTCPDNAWKLTLVGTINSVGQLVGLPICGFISDRFGRKKALLFSLLGGSLFGITRSFSQSYEMFLTFEFLEAVCLSGSYIILSILAMELVTPRRRELGGAVIVWAFAFGMVWLGFISWALRQWRDILRALYVPALLFISYIWLIPESVRWLMLRGRLNDARNIIKRVAATNKVQLSESLEAELVKWQDESLETFSEEEDKGEPTFTALKQVIKSRTLLIRLATCSFCWVTNTLVYYGLSLNSVSLAGTDDIYLNFILVSLVEAPAYIFAWIGMISFGRRKTLVVSLLISGVACFANPFVPQEIGWAQLLLYLVGKFAISSSFDVLYVYTAEIFPTRLRTSMMGACSMVGRIGSMIAPQTPLLSYISPLLPMVLFGVVALLAAVLALLFPETLGHSLPDSVEEAEVLGAVLDPTSSQNTQKEVK